MSAKRKKSSLSQSSMSGSELSDSSRQLETLAAKKRKHSGDSSDGSGGGGRGRSKSKSRSRSGSGSGSDSGTAKSRSGSGSRSRSGSGSPASRKGSSSDKKSASGSSSGSDSGTEGSEGAKKSPVRAEKKSSSDASHRSSGSEKGKKLLKASERRASSKLQSTLSNDSDSEYEDNAPKISKKIPKLKKPDAEEKIFNTWRDEFDDGLDSDLVGDDDDRDNLNDMTEKQREEELFKRAERREELKKRFEISQKLRLQQKNKKDNSDQSMSNSDGDKDKEGAYHLEGPQARRKGYEEKHSKKFSALNNLKAMREEKERKENQRKEKEKKNKKQDSDSGSDLEKIGKGGKNKKKLKASDIYSSSSSDGGKDEVRRKSSSSSSSSSSSVSSISSGESDTERHKSKKVVKKAKVIENREELEKIRLSRFKIDKFVHLPIFKKVVVGCFVRLGIGHNKEKNVSVYRVAEITDVCETVKVYDVMKSRTNIGLRMKHGKQERVFRAQFISNQPFSESEFQKWRQTCEVEHVELPTNQVVADKVVAIQKALTYRFSNYDVDKILASKEKFSKHPHNYAMTKAKLMKEKGQALDEGNTEQMEKLDTQLAELEERAEELDKRRTSSISTISLINDRNRKNNITRAETCILREAKQVRLEGKIDDPFTRRKTIPMLSTGKNTDADVAEEEVEMTTERLLQLEKLNKEKAEKAAHDKAVQMENIRRKMDGEDGMSKKEKIKMDREKKGSSTTQDIFNAHDFDIDINVSEMTESLIPSSIAVKPVTTSAGPSMGPTKRSLKIEEWKKRKGII